MSELRIPGHGEIRDCLVCGANVADNASMTYHARVLPLGAASPVPACTDLAFALDDPDLKALGEALGPHLCRRCAKCGFIWVEAPLHAAAPYVPESPEEAP